MDGADYTRDISSELNDRHEQNALENPHLYRWRSRPPGSDSDSNENGPSNNEFDEMVGVEHPYAPPSTPAGSQSATDANDNVSDGDSDIRYGPYTLSALYFTPPYDKSPTGCQFGVNSVQNWWDRPQALNFDEFEIKLVHSAILHIIVKEEEQRRAEMPENLEIAKEAEKKAAEQKDQNVKMAFRKALVDTGFMTEKEFEDAERRARVKMEKEREEEEAKKRDNELKLDAAKKTVDNLVFAAADKKTPKDAFNEGRRVGRLLFWRAIEGEDECIDTVDTLSSHRSLILECLLPRLCQTAWKQENPVVGLSLVGGIERAYRKLAKKIPQDPPIADSHPEGRRFL